MGTSPLYACTAPKRSDSPERNPLDDLTARQKQIVALLLQGHSNKVIARSLGISPNTVKVHVHAILKELKVQSRMDLAVTLLRANPAQRAIVRSVSVNELRCDPPMFRFGERLY